MLGWVRKFLDSNVAAEDTDDYITEVTQTKQEGKKTSVGLSDYETTFMAINQNGLALEYYPKYANNKEIVLQAVRQNGLAIEFVGEKLSTDLEVIMEALKENYFAGYILWITNRPSKDLAMSIVKEFPHALEFFESFQNDFDVVSVAIENDGTSIQWAKDDIRMRRDICLKAVKQTGMAYPYIFSEFFDEEMMKFSAMSNGLSIQFLLSKDRNNEDIAIEAVKQNGFAYKYLDYRLKKKKKFALVALENDPNTIEIIHPDFKKDKEFIMKYVRKSPNTFKYLPKSLKKDKFIVEEIAEIDYNIVEFMDEKLKSDTDFWFKLIDIHPRSIKYASPSVQNNHFVLLYAVSFNGLCLRYASEYIRNSDEEVIIKAVKQNGQALYYTQNKSKEIVMEAVCQDGLSLIWCLDYSKDDVISGKDHGLTEDIDVVRDAIQQNGLAIQYVGPKMMKNRNIVIEALNQNGLALNYIHVNFRNDPEILDAAKKIYDKLKPTGNTAKLCEIKFLYV